MKTVLITGASSGIGAGLAKSFSADGYHVIACGRDPARLEALHQTCPNLTVRLFDMTDREACRQALTGSYADLIILCAGTCEYLDGGVVDAALVERVMNTNFLGPVNCLEALQPQLVRGNRVVLVSSMAHWLPFPRAEAYGASKAALSWFAESLRLDWEPKGLPSRLSLRASSIRP
jgi:NAD(P)-dependent dehydrogenase (short-subunit alcohol dehydrogenase family)